mmetsp:Transcript_59916/g.152051  ORF Transcript_59916/g.152051 Transcript_59916/m.152051 type:complete len:263 (-) Transcript_59916:915-1703(-)
MVALPISPQLSLELRLLDTFPGEGEAVLELLEADLNDLLVLLIDLPDDIGILGLLHRLRSEEDGAWSSISPRCLGLAKPSFFLVLHEHLQDFLLHVNVVVVEWSVKDQDLGVHEERPQQANLHLLGVAQHPLPRMVLVQLHRLLLVVGGAVSLQHPLRRLVVVLHLIFAQLPLVRVRNGRLALLLQLHVVAPRTRVHPRHPRQGSRPSTIGRARKPLRNRLRGLGNRGRKRRSRYSFFGPPLLPSFDLVSHQRQGHGHLELR